MKNYSRFLALVIFYLTCFVPIHSVAAAVLWGSVVEVLDGATMMVDVDKRLIKVRLCTVIPPKKDDPLAEVAASHLASMIKGNR